MIEEYEFSEKETKIIELAKKTQKILAKVIEDRDPREVIKEIGCQEINEVIKHIDQNKKIDADFLAKIIREKGFLKKIINYSIMPVTKDKNLEKLVEELVAAVKDKDPSVVIKEDILKKIIRKLAQDMKKIDCTEIIEVIKDIDQNEEINDELLADVILKKNFLKKIINFCPKSIPKNDNLEKLVEELVAAIKELDPSIVIKEDRLKQIITKLAQVIQDRITPDIPGLNPKDEGAMIGRLGPHIFDYLMTRLKSQDIEKPCRHRETS